MTVPVVTGISFDHPFYTIGQTITATVAYETTNQYASYDFSPIVTDSITEETSASTSATFFTAYDDTGPEGYTDPFTGSILDSYWSPFTSSSSVTVTVADDEVVVDLPGGESPGSINWGGIVATAPTTLVGSSYIFQITGAPGAAQSSVGMYLTTTASSDTTFPAFGGIYNYITAAVSTPGILTCGWSDSANDGNIQIVESASYSTSSSLYVRIRELDSTVYWDTSTDDATWTNIASLTDSTLPFSLTSLYATLAGDDHGDVGGTGVAFTNFAYDPEGGGTPDPTDVTATDTGDRTWTLVSNTLSGSTPPFSGTAVLTATA